MIIVTILILNALLISAYNVHEKSFMIRDVRDSYFGYSVLLHAQKDPPKSWMIVGAPKSKIASVEEPGLVYRYDLKSNTSQSVRPMDLDPEMGLISSINLVVSTKKDYGWFGAAMALQPDEDVLAVCAPRTTVTLKGLQFSINSMHGACYVGRITSDKLHLDDKNLETHDFKAEHWYNPLHGFSVHYPSSSPNSQSKMISGAPKEQLVGSIRIGDRQNLVYEPLVDDLTMFGYSVTSGRFFSESELLYVGGSPGWNSVGQVAFIDPRTDPETIIARIDGKTVGEYFGGSLTACDMNGDGLDELIVGAPHWGEDYGKVYIFFGNAEKLTEGTVDLRGQREGSLFGYSLACGDLDGDGSDDLIVGAPWEGNGAVYIFNGDPLFQSGFNQKFQKITAPPIVTTFGFSISPPVDVDDNGFPDFAVGAYKSNQAGLYYSRPVIKTHIKATTIPSSLHQNSSSFVISVCVNHTRKDLPTAETFTLTIDVDGDRHRVNQSQLLLYYNASSTDSKLSGICLNATVFLKKIVLNFVDPINIMITHTFGLPPILKNKDTVECDLCPMEYKGASSKVQETLIPFDIKCGSDEICTASISLSGRFYETKNHTSLKNNTWAIGSNEVGLEINITNHRDPAYFTILTLNLPRDVVLQRSSCTEEEEDGILIIVCTLDKPLIAGAPKTFLFDLDMSKINNGSYDNTNINFNATVATRSRQQGDSSVIFPLLLKSNISLVLEGHANARSYDILSTGEAIPNITFEQTYQISKFGPTPMAIATLTVKVPYKIRNTEIVTLTNAPKISVAGEMLPCAVYNIPVLPISGKNTLQLLDRDNANIFHLSTNVTNSRNKTETDRLVRSLVTSDNDTSSNGSLTFLPLRQSGHNLITLNCSTPDVECGAIVCDIYSLNADRDNARLRLQFFTNSPKLMGEDKLKDNDQIVEFITEAWVDIVQPVVNWTIPGSKKTTKVTTTFLKIKPSSNISVWIVAGSVLLGLLVLVLIAIALKLMGFFRRNKKDELDAIRNQDCTKETRRLSDTRL